MKADIKKLGWDVVGLHLKLSQAEVTESFFRQEVRRLAEDYAKLKVIEELEEIIDMIQCSENLDSLREHITSKIELKQER